MGAAQTASAGRDVVDSNSNNHVIGIDTDGGAPDQQPPECAVCMEPLEWVAVGACGHDAVCAACAVRLRSVQRDRRCCICREYCVTVVVTKPGGGGGSGSEGGRAYAELARVSVLFRAALARRRYWYHGGASAYFDDKKQYEAAVKACQVVDAGVDGAGDEDVDGAGDEDVDGAGSPCGFALAALLFIFICLAVSYLLTSVIGGLWQLIQSM